VRQEIVLATKVRLPMSENFNRSGATRVNIMREVEARLRRLQTDYIDLYQVHGWDSNTPLEETLRTLDDLVAPGEGPLYRTLQLHVMAGGHRGLCSRSAWGWRST
jgi:aryl-alcohol dehydrogenase-like predicted oxidoreductase